MQETYASAFEIEDADERLSAEQARRELRNALGDLTPEQRRALELRVIDDLRFAEVAATMSTHGADRAHASDARAADHARGHERRGGLAVTALPSNLAVVGEDLARATLSDARRSLKRRRLVTCAVAFALLALTASAAIANGWLLGATTPTGRGACRRSRQRRDGRPTSRTRCSRTSASDVSATLDAQLRHDRERRRSASFSRASRCSACRSSREPAARLVLRLVRRAMARRRLGLVRDGSRARSRRSSPMAGATRALLAERRLLRRAGRPAGAADRAARATAARRSCRIPPCPLTDPDCTRTKTQNPRARGRNDAPDDHHDRPSGATGRGTARGGAA